MTEFIKRLRIIPYISPVVFDRLKTDEQGRCFSNIEYEESWNVKKVAFIRTQIKKGVEYFSLATGNIVDKDGKKYYEVYPELYTLKECRVIDSVLRNIL